MDKCNTCHNPYRPDCDWNQGRCPNHPPIINISKIFSKIKETFKHDKKTLDRTVSPKKD